MSGHRDRNIYACSRRCAEQRPGGPENAQMGFVVIPGSKNVAHIRDNLDILDFTLSDDEMTEIAQLNKGKRFYHRTDEALAGFAGWQPTYEKE